LILFHVIFLKRRRIHEDHVRAGVGLWHGGALLDAGT
jgi:hypothetical protein